MTPAGQEHGVTRSDAIAVALGVFASVWGAGVARPSGARAATANSDPATPNDRTALSFVYLAEYLQIALYEAAARTPVSAAVRRFAAEALAQERAHLRTLVAINRRHDIVPNRPSASNLNFGDERRYLLTLQRVEEAVVGGYGGVAVAIEAPSLYLADLVPILAEEMTQLSAIQSLLGGVRAPSFTDPRPPADVQPILDTPQATGG